MLGDSMNLLTLLALGLVICATSVKAQSSFVTFTVANHFCEKARLGMEPIAAYQTAFRRVLDRQFYDADYDLPNWNTFVSNEMYRLCPAEYYKLVNALAGEEKKIALKKKAAAEAKKSYS